MYRICFIGAGNMTKAMVQGLISGGYERSLVSVSNRSEDKLDYFSTQLGVAVFNSNLEAIQGADIIVLSVKPQQMEALCLELKSTLPEDALIISVAAGIPLEFYTAVFPRNDTVRAMPNLAVSSGSGVTALFSDRDIDDQYSLKDLLSVWGLVIWLGEESQMSVITAVASSGVALYAVFSQVFEEKLRAYDLASDDARRIVSQLLLGVIKLAEQFDQWQGLADCVTSPGGTTEAALTHLNMADFYPILDEALGVAIARSDQITKEYAGSVTRSS